MTYTMKLRTALLSLIAITSITTTYAEQLNQEEFNERVEMSLLISKILGDKVINAAATKSNDTEETIKNLCFYKSTVQGLLDLSIENIELEGAIRMIKEAGAEVKHIEDMFTDAGSTYFQTCKGYTL